MDFEKMRSYYGMPNTIPLCLSRHDSSDAHNEIVFGNHTRLSFHRTLRVPEDGRHYPLPAGLGRFPIHRVEDYPNKVPASWLKTGGFFLPIYQKEALFLQFDGPSWHPTIAKVCVGKINAISAKPYSEKLSAHDQDYVVIPRQRWLDGINAGHGLVKQFVAMPLGSGYTVEAQITDEELTGGIQIVVMDARPGKFPDRDPDIDERILDRESKEMGLRTANPPQTYNQMGIAAGGSIKQQIIKDIYGVDTWDPSRMRAITVHLVNSIAYKAITGFDPPSSPINAQKYDQAKIPWFSHYEESAPVVKPPSLFKRIISVGQIAKNRGEASFEDSILRMKYEQRIKEIRAPNSCEASATYRKMADDSRLRNEWETALRQISYVIDLNVDVTAEDYALRSCCNCHLGRYKDGSIDGSLGLGLDKNSYKSLAWRAYCRMHLGEYDALYQDAVGLMKFSETELIGLELKAEAALKTDRLEEAFNNAADLFMKSPGHRRASEIMSEIDFRKSKPDLNGGHDV